ncbi:rhomboid family intramembrane serine protease [Algoriphagus aestuarii]|nr:rhomboid family intramembrane serine protease [Algoriphagus aestuarii]
MRIGFTPKYILDFSNYEKDNDRLLILALEAVKQLNWNLSYVDNSGFIAYTNFSIFSWSEEVSVQIKDDQIKIKSECTGVQIFDFGKNENNVSKLLEKIDDIKAKISEEEIELRISEFKVNHHLTQKEKQPDSFSKKKPRIDNFLSIFYPTEGYFVTPILIIINLLVFSAMVVSGVHFLIPHGQDLLNWGANYLPATLNGQVWRLLTSIFLHIGILHLILNMYALLYIGILLEPILGKSRFLFAYLLSGITASLVSIQWNQLHISAGASGAIFGMYGVFLALLISNFLEKSVRKAFLSSIVVFVGYNLLVGLNPESQIDNAAHIGGLICGIIAGFAFIPGLKNPENKLINYSTYGALFFPLIIYSFSFFRVEQYDLDKYEKEIDRFVSMEAMALDAYMLPDETPDQEIIDELQNRGLYYWNENLKILEGFKKMNLPSQIKERNIKLEEYCSLRIKSYQIIIKAIEQDSEQYTDEIMEYEQKINEIISELTGN